MKMSKLDILTDLQEFISDALTESHLVRFGTVSEKKHHRKLKCLDKELDRWIDELHDAEKHKSKEKS